MALTGEAKKAYQRELMRQKRSNKGSNKSDVRPSSVRPKMLDPGEAPIAWSEGPVGGTRTLTITKGGSVLEVVVDSRGRPCTYARK